MLANAIPNPFNPTTRIAFELPWDGSVRLEVLDAAGRVASGVYHYRLTTPEGVRARRMSLVK